MNKNLGPHEVIALGRWFVLRRRVLKTGVTRPAGAWAPVSPAPAQQDAVEGGHDWVRRWDKKRRHKNFGDYVIPHVEKTGRRSKLSGSVTWTRDEPAARRQTTTAGVTVKHIAQVQPS